MTMKISIGNNNRIKNSTIGNNNNNNSKDKDNKTIKIIIEIVVGLIVAFIVYKLGWNK